MATCLILLGQNLFSLSFGCEQWGASLLEVLDWDFIILAFSFFVGEQKCWFFFFFGLEVGGQGQGFWRYFGSVSFYL